MRPEVRPGAFVRLVRRSFLRLYPLEVATRPMGTWQVGDTALVVAVGDRRVFVVTGDGLGWAYPVDGDVDVLSPGVAVL